MRNARFCVWFAGSVHETNPVPGSALHSVQLYRSADLDQNNSAATRAYCRSLRRTAEMAAQLPSAHSGSRIQLVASAGFDMLHNEFVSHLLRNHDDGRYAREELYKKLEAAGYEVGRRYAERISRDKERLTEMIDIIKFLCRDFWQDVFRKPIDKLQTNNKGVYVLQDFNFRWIRFTSGAPTEDTKAQTLRYVLFPCGMIRGALSAFGMECSVNADISAMPRTIFHIRVKD